MATNAPLLIRRQVATLLDVTKAEVKARENLTLHPGKAPDGSYRYDPHEVAAVLRGVFFAVLPAESDGDTFGASLMATPLLRPRYRGSKPCSL